jgi:OmcA/MtrC family decaheme c-type cytochrome
MHESILKKAGTLLLAGALALAGCQGDDGDVGPAGNPGQPGAPGEPGAPGAPGEDLAAAAKPESCSVCHPDAGFRHQAGYDAFTDTTQLSVEVDGIASVANPDPATTYTSTLTFTITGADGQPLTDPALLKQKTFYAGEYDPGTKKFSSANSFSFCTAVKDPCTTKIEPTGTPGQYTVKNLAAPFAPELAANAMIYGYVATGTPIVAPAGHYNLYPDVYNFGVVIKGEVTYDSTANVAACESCHGQPYRKHGYRMAVVPGLNDFVGCKACHTDQRGGHDQAWQLLADDPAAFAAQGGKPTPGQETKYAYTATVMNDTHMSHAMEFAYPQSMANCVTCHKGKLDRVLTDANFTLTTCKSCHPVTGGAVADRDAKRAPPLMDLIAAYANVHPTDLYTFTGDCNGCHKAGGVGKDFREVHAGYDKTIYANETTKHASAVAAKIDSASYDSATKKLTVAFSVTGAQASAIVKPTVVISLYGYDTKDFIVGGHSSQPAPDGKRNLEWTEGATNNSPRLTVTPAAATAGNTSWTATADLTLWAGLLADGSVKKAEIGILPALGLDQTVAPQNDATKAAYNPYLAIAGVTKTFDLIGNKAVENAYGKAIVDTAKCNACHDTLGTTFHSPSYGSAGVVACRLCHVVGSGGSHLEMQSRSIDSYVHSIHSMQPFDIGDIDFSNPVEAMRYQHHVESTYPNFTNLNCESCHNPGTYEVPDQSKSLPGVLSAADSVDGRTIGAVPAYVTGPGSRACGSCHRTELINEDAAGQLAAFNEHAATFGYALENDTGVLDAAIAKIMAFFK